ncbi:MAG: molybdopterin-dependent oxidoreductase [Deltaproteobacteria bacterium]|nr:molybdopterin-dependent oxidoreductase [Deltaproteobacteria bacterium]
MNSKTAVANGEIQTLCRQCDMRCGLNVHVAHGKIHRISGFKDHPASRGLICAKGRAAVDLVYHPRRLLNPLRRKPDRTFEEISYEQAMDEIAGRMRDIKEDYGARSVGVWTGEAVGFFQQEQYARRFIHAFGSPNFFSADSVCFSARYIAYRLVQGYLNPCPDFERAALIILWGSNPPVSHPTFMSRITEGRKKGAKLVVIDPRRTAIARKADIFVQPLPGTDGALALGLARYLIETGNYDRHFVKNHTVGFDRFASYARTCTPEWVERQTGVDRTRILQIGGMLAASRPRVAGYVGNGLEHHDNVLDTVRAVACLGGLCGAVDVEGGDPWPETMGGRTLTLYDEIPLEGQEPIGAAEYPTLYRYTKDCHSLTAMDRILFSDGYPLKGLIVTGANPVLTNPNAQKVARAFARLDLLVFRDLFLTESAKLAHYILPAVSFLERSELHYHTHLQLVTLTTKVLDIPGVRDEYTFWRDLACRLGFGERYFPWENEEQVNQWILEPAGISLDELRRHPEGYTYRPLRYRKYTNRPLPTPTGKFEFSSAYLGESGHPELPEYRPPRYRSRSNPDYPFILITGARKSLYYHSRYRNIARFRASIPVPQVEIHPDDAARMGITEGQRVKVTSTVGSIEIPARVMGEKDILPGVLQITHGWDEANVNLLTDDRVTDPVTGFPLLKAVPVRIEKLQ